MIQVWVQILGKEEVPSLNEVISLIRPRESHRGVRLEPQSTNIFALVAFADHRQGLTMEQPQNAKHGKADSLKRISWNNL